MKTDQILNELERLENKLSNPNLDHGTRLEYLQDIAKFKNQEWKFVK